MVLFMLARESRALVYPVELKIPVTDMRKKAFQSLDQFFKSYDTAVLKGVQMPVIKPDEPARMSDGDLQYMQAKNVQLISLLNALNPQLYRPDELRPDDEMLVLAGAVELYRQLAGGLAGRMKAPWECIKNVIMDAFDITVAWGDILVLFETNTTWANLRPVLWRFLRKYGGWLTVAGVVYDIVTECL